MYHYQKKLYVARVNKDDKIINPVERWEAHKNSLLHRGFTAILIYENKIVFQHRKHLVFDGYYDMTFSSHQSFNGANLQNDLEAVYSNLSRECSIDRKDLLKQPVFINKVYYRAKDPKSEYSEHEIDYIYIAELKNKPDPNPEYAYGYELVERNSLPDPSSLPHPLAPWVNKILEKNSLIMYAE